MSKRRFRLPSPALVISMITLSLVLGGTAFAAAATHGDKKADTKLIKQLAPTLSVKHAQTADSATNATNATNATTATNATNATNATSATNATNATNATTAATANALAGAQLVEGAVTAVGAGAQASESVVCPAGMFAIGGNEINDSVDTTVSVNEVEIFGTGNNTLKVFVNNTGAGSVAWHAYAVCVKGSEGGSDGPNVVSALSKR